MATIELKYFGTDLRSAGHYFHRIYEKGDADRDSMIRFDKLPFNPEALPYGPNYYIKGAFNFYYVFGFTIMAISGSVADGRPGCKSVFFVEEIMEFPRLENLIRSTEFGRTVLETLIKPTQNQ
jgi:hypothetical protein